MKQTYIMTKEDDAQARTLGWEVELDPYQGNHINFNVNHNTNDIVTVREQAFAKALREGDPLHVKVALVVIFGEFEP